MCRSLLWAAAAAVVALAGCSSDTDTDTDTTTPASSGVAGSEPRTAAPGEVELSPDGVTTAVGAPAWSTEEEYFQACRAARVWMDQQGGDPKTQIEPYLKTLQTSDSAGPGTYGTPWSQLAPERQAAVIVAVEAAADALCG